jgi:hypothetical protein
MASRSRIEQLLAELNHLEQEYGRAQHELDPNYDTPGEARAWIELLKDDLAKLGVRVRWNGRRYEIVLPGNREQPNG